jgi:hypothetical protein
MKSEQSLLFPNEVARKTTTRERRVWARYPSRIDGTCQPIAAETATEPEMGWPGEIIDVSRGGIGLSLERRFEPGTPLVIELAGEGDEPPRLLEVDVVHTRPQADGRWIHGCELRAELSEHDLQALV